MEERGEICSGSLGESTIKSEQMPWSRVVIRELVRLTSDSSANREPFQVAVAGHARAAIRGERDIRGQSFSQK